MRGKAYDFIRSLFGESNENYILIWTLQQKKSQWFRDAEQAAAYADAQKDNSDIYIGVGLSPEDYGQNRRCDNANIAGIGGLWLDMDIQSKHHKKKNLPPDLDAAMDLIHSLGGDNMRPTSIVHSGNGVQAWWMFKEIWEFENAEEREEASILAKRFIYTFKEKAWRKGWDVDSVFDFARVLRIPGTLNHKSNPPKEVRLLEHDERLRYDPTEIERYCIDLSELPASVTQPTEDDGSHSFVLRENAKPPFDKFEALREIEPKFAASWERTRRDMQDTSASSYDLSLASFAALAGWSDQEIVNLLIASRRKHGDDLKLRHDYYSRTIKRSRIFIEKTRAQEEIDDYATEDEEEKAAMNDSRREALLSNLSALFNVQIKRIVKYLSDPPQYRLETSDGSVMLGDVGALIEQSQFRKKVAGASGRYIPRFKGDRWDNIAQALLDVCVPEGIGDEATTEGTARAWLEGYLEEKKPIEFDEVEELSEIVTQKMPFKKDGKIHIFGNDLRRWLKISQLENISSKEMGTILRAYGAIPDKLNYKAGDSRTSKSIWILPPYHDE